MATEFGKLLRIIRINSGDSAKEMAHKLSLSPSYLSAIENGKRSIPADMDHMLARAYPLTEADRSRLLRAILDTGESIKVNLTEFSEKKQRILYALMREDIPEDILSDMCNLVYSSKEEQEDENK